MCGWGLVGCATGTKPTSSEPTAQRLYNVGEERFAAGRPDQAVALWRHAITQLPSTEQYDGLRHKLILRLGFGEIVTYHHTGKLAHLFEAKKLLERYLVAHESLFGESAAAKAERGQVYELLYEVESRIEDPPETVAASAAVGMVEPTALASAPSDPEASATPDASEPRSKRRRRPREDAEGNERVVVVDTRGRPSVDDPELRQALRSWAPEGGLQLTQASIEPWLPARAYVRVEGRARRLDHDDGAPTQAVAAAVIRSVRPALRACYDGAFARAPADYALATVEFTIDAEGNVAAPKIVDGEVGDALGDVCVLEHLAEASAAQAKGVEPMHVAVNLLFFYDAAVRMNEGGGRSWRNELDSMVDFMAATASARRRGYKAEVPRNLPGITQ